MAFPSVFVRVKKITFISPTRFPRQIHKHTSHTLISRNIGPSSLCPEQIFTSIVKFRILSSYFCSFREMPREIKEPWPSLLLREINSYLNWRILSSYPTNPFTPSPINRMQLIVQLLDLLRDRRMAMITLYATNTWSKVSSRKSSSRLKIRCFLVLLTVQKFCPR